MLALRNVMLEPVLLLNSSVYVTIRLKRNIVKIKRGRKKKERKKEETYYPKGYYENYFRKLELLFGLFLVEFRC